MPRKELVVSAREGLSLVAELLAELPRLFWGLIASSRVGVLGDPFRDPYCPGPGVAIRVMCARLVPCRYSLISISFTLSSLSAAILAHSSAVSLPSIPARPGVHRIVSRRAENGVGDGVPSIPSLFHRIPPLLHPTSQSPGGPLNAPANPQGAGCPLAGAIARVPTWWAGTGALHIHMYSACGTCCHLPRHTPTHAGGQRWY